MTPKERIEALEQAQRDFERGIRHAYGTHRLDIAVKLSRIRRQFAMLTEDQRKPSEPVQRRWRA